MQTRILLLKLSNPPMNTGKLCFIKKLMEVMLNGEYLVFSFFYCASTSGVQYMAHVH